MISSNETNQCRLLEAAQGEFYTVHPDQAFKHTDSKKFISSSTEEGGASHSSRWHWRGQSFLSHDCPGEHWVCLLFPSQTHVIIWADHLWKWSQALFSPGVSGYPSTRGEAALPLNAVTPSVTFRGRAKGHVMLGSTRPRLRNRKKINWTLKSESEWFDQVCSKEEASKECDSSAFIGSHCVKKAVKVKKVTIHEYEQNNW